MPEIKLKFRKILTSQGEEWKLFGNSVDYYAKFPDTTLDLSFPQVEMEMETINIGEETNVYADEQVPWLKSVEMELDEDQNNNYEEDTSSLSIKGENSFESEVFDPFDVKTEPVDCGKYANLHQLVPSTTEQHLRDFYHSITGTEEISVNNDLVVFPVSSENDYSTTESLVAAEENGPYDLTTAAGYLHLQLERNNCYQTDLPKPEVFRAALFNWASENDEFTKNRLPDVSPLRSRSSSPHKLDPSVEQQQQIPFQKSFYCSTCSSSFTTMKGLREHTEIHNIGKPFACNKCDASFKWKCDLESHTIEHNDRQPFICVQCSASFYFKHHLDKHTRLHSEPGDSPTHDIFHSVFSKRKLTSLIEGSGKKFICSHCPAKFTTKSTLQSHMRVHTQEKPFQCDLCPAKFAWKGNLKTHEKTHLRKPFVCEVCSLTFHTNFALQSHTKVHRVWRLYECDMCSLQFPRKKLLQDHAKNHLPRAEFSCSYCSLVFSTAEMERTHTKLHHVKKYPCLLCNASFTKRRTLKKHVILEVERLTSTLDKLRSTVQFSLKRKHSRELRSRSKF